MEKERKQCHTYCCDKSADILINRCKMRKERDDAYIQEIRQNIAHSKTEEQPVIVVLEYQQTGCLEVE